MKRYKSISIELVKGLLNVPKFQEILDSCEIWEQSEVKCPETGRVMIWLSDDYDVSIVEIPTINIMFFYRAWYDSGSEEILVTEKTYRDYTLPQKQQFYKQRKGTYDPST